MRLTPSSRRQAPVRCRSLPLPVARAAARAPAAAPNARPAPPCASARPRSRRTPRRRACGPIFPAGITSGSGARRVTATAIAAAPSPCRPAWPAPARPADTGTARRRPGAEHGAARGDRRPAVPRACNPSARSAGNAGAAISTAHRRQRHRAASARRPPRRHQRDAALPAPRARARRRRRPGGFSAADAGALASSCADANQRRRAHARRSAAPARIATMTFEEMDRNFDGVISRFEYERLPALSAARGRPAAAAAGAKLRLLLETRMNAPTALSHLVPEVQQRDVPAALIDALKARFGDQLLHGAWRCASSTAATSRRSRRRRRPPWCSPRARRTWPMRCGWPAQYGVPVIPFGVGSSLEGHLLAVQGGISIDVQPHEQGAVDQRRRPDGHGAARRHAQAAERRDQEHRPVLPDRPRRRRLASAA